MSSSTRGLRRTRGKRLRRVVEEEQEADDEFWGQEFFQEDEEDVPYLTESDQESVADSDFSNSVRRSRSLPLPHVFTTQETEEDDQDEETEVQREKPQYAIPRVAAAQ